LPLFPAIASTLEEDSARQIAQTFAALDAENKYTEQLTYSDMNTLPLGMKKTINNNELTVAASNIRYHEKYAELTLFARLRISQRQEPLFFAASGVRISYEGGFMGDASLALIGDQNISINEHTVLTLKGGEFDGNTGTVNSARGSSITVDCAGLKELTIDASLRFSESLIRKVSDAGQPDGPVTSDFRIVAGDWNDLLVELSFPRFQIRGLEGFTFKLEGAVFDFSDSRNSGHIHFPDGYEDKYLVPGAYELWRGVYAREVEVGLPSDFSADETPPAFRSLHLLIDDNGVSGYFAAEHILPIEKGNASGWAFSIDRFWLDMEAHKIKRGGFDGIIGLPVSEGTRLDYTAQIMGNNHYQLAVSPVDNLDFDMFAGKAVLNANSWISIEMNNGKFLPEANLNGYLTLKSSLSEPEGNNGAGGNIKMENIEFRNLHLKTQNPYLTVDYMGYKGEIQLMGLPVSVSGIAVTANDREAVLGFNLSLNLDEQHVSVSTHLNFSAVYAVNGNRGIWKRNGVRLDEIAIRNCTIAGILTLDGRLQWMKDDPVFGEGFYGSISLEFKEVLKGCKLSVASAFGTKDGSRYWFVDGSIGLPMAIPVGGVVGIKGFGGSLSKGMERKTDAGSGGSRMGCSYVPNKDWGLGLKAAVLFASTGSDVVSGDASFEIMFNKSGGVNTIGFYGYLEFMANIPLIDNVQSQVTSLFKQYVDTENDLVKGSLEELQAWEKKKQENPSQAAGESGNSKQKAANASMAAVVGMLYNFPEKTFHANFDFYVNVAGGIIRGTASDNRAGYGVLHFSPSKWYIHLGRPDDRVGLQLGIPGIATVKATSYFMLGDEMPEAPAPPREVADILQEKQETLNYMRDLNALQSGKGIAFGSSLGFDTGDLVSNSILYARFNTGAGFDVMIKDYQNAQCKDRSGPIGMNGWYANGQAYAYLNGELGVKVNLKIIQTRCTIIKGGTAALLQAKLPNPTWFGGQMGVRFEVLNGLVKGNMKFKFSLGDECEIIYPGSSPLDVSMISDLSPAANASEVDVFTAPQLALSYPAQSPFTVEEENGPKTYRISLDKLVVKDGDTVISGDIKWNKDNTLATFYPFEVLPPHKPLRVEVAVGFEEEANGRWIVVTASGQKAQETREINFVTGDAPDYIPLHNIEYAYPLLDQQYYYPKEFTKGYVQLKQGQSYLFPQGWTYDVRIDRSGKSEKAAFSYDAGKKRLHYNLPSLSKSQEYAIRFSSASQTQASENTTTATKEIALLNEDGNTVLQSSAAAGQVIRENDGKLLLAYSFSSSKYNTFADKINGMKKRAFTVNVIGSNIIALGWDMSSMTEELEEAEISGTEAGGNKPLVKGTALLNDKYYKEWIAPLVYANYSTPGAIKLNRDGDETGVPPVYAFGRWKAGSIFPIRYEAPKYYFYDFGELRDKYVNAGNTAHPLYGAAYFPDILPGKYTATFQYILPGGEQGSSVEFEYNVEK
jgi:hypothetical protein